MNKTKRVAWHKHLKKAKKRHEKARAEGGTPAARPATGAATTHRPAPARRATPTS